MGARSAPVGANGLYGVGLGYYYQLLAPSLRSAAPRTGPFGGRGGVGARARPPLPAPFGGRGPGAGEFGVGWAPAPGPLRGPAGGAWLFRPLTQRAIPTGRSRPPLKGAGVRRRGEPYILLPRCQVSSPFGGRKFKY